MSAQNPSNSVDGAAEATQDTTSTLSKISVLDSELSSLSSKQQGLTLISSIDTKNDNIKDKEHVGIVHDLVPVHTILVELAEKLQVKVNQASVELSNIRKKLSAEMRKTAETLASLDEVRIPPNLTALPSSSVAEPSPREAILAIHKYRDQAVSSLRIHADILSATMEINQFKDPAEDFNTASDRLDSSFQLLRLWLDQVGQAGRKLQSYDDESITLRKFSGERCKEIDALEKNAVLQKMSELSVRNCSLQSRKPVRSLGHTLDLQEIMLIAKSAKSLVYEISLQMLKIVDLIKEEEILATDTYHKLTKENSELLRRYCFYLKLKIQQL